MSARPSRRLLLGRQAPEHPAGQQLVDRAVDDGRSEGRIDVLAELAALDAAGDHALQRVDRQRELADPLGQLRAAAELLDHDPDDVRQMEPGAQHDRRDVTELVRRRLVGLLHALDPRDEEVPVLVEDRLEHLVLGLEVVVEEPVGDARLLGDVADPARVEPLAREDAHGSVEELPPFVLYRRRLLGQGGQEPTPASARLSPLEASPCQVPSRRPRPSRSSAAGRSG